MRKIVFLTILFLTVSASVSGSPPIELKSGEITPAQENKPSVNLFSSKSVDKQKHFLVQLEEIPEGEPEKWLEERGVKPLSYVPENTWYTSVPVNKISELKQAENIAFIGKIGPENKISSSINKTGERKELQITTFKDSSRKKVEKQLEKIGEIKGSSQYSNIWTVEISDNNLDSVARKNFVKWIEPSPPSLQTHNIESREVIGANTIQESSSYNLTGNGFTAAIWDAGWAGLHEDLNQSGKTVRGDSGHEVRDHGTHVAGTMLGSGNLDSDLRGVAPNSSLVTYEWPGGDEYSTTSDEIYAETEDAVSNHDTVLSQNSWGWDTTGGDDEPLGKYGSNSADYDNIIHGSSHIEPLSVVFSAGNERNREPGYNTTLGPGATAKNTITVGAVNDYRKPTVYSSWGPTDDGRLKPDLVANGGSYSSGSAIKSTVPDKFINILPYDCGGNGDDFCYPYSTMQGTSMSSPAVSGAILLLHEQFDRTFKREPSPATTKAVLVHTADDINRTGPDYITGWGVTNITEAADYVKESREKELIKKDSVTDGQTSSYNVIFEHNSQRPNITLVWNDYPGQPSTSSQLVNDLDLVIRDSNGTRYYPWTLNWSTRKEPAKQDRQDRKNNVVQTSLPSDVEEIDIEVKGHKVPEGPQDYTLLLPKKVAAGPSTEILSPKNSSFSSSKVDLNISTSTEIDKAYFSVDGSSNQTLGKNGSYWTSTAETLEDGKHSVTFYINKSGLWDSKTEHFTVDTKLPDVTAVKPSNSSNISGTLNISGSASDSLTGVKYRNYSIDQGNHTGSFNTTLNSSELADSDHTIKFTAVDSAGNLASTVTEFTADNSPPNIEPVNISSNSTVTGNLSIEAVWNDSTTGVNISRYELVNSSGVQKSESLNSILNTSEFEDGSYNLSFIAEDFASNTETSLRTNISIDNKPPETGNRSFSSDTYFSEAEWINFSSTDKVSGVELSKYRLLNSSQNITSWREQNTLLNTSKFEEKNYSIETRVKDSIGNSKTELFENITFDNTHPSINTTVLNESRKINGWRKDFRKANVSCLDENAVNGSEVASNGTYLTSESSNVTFRLEKSGEYNYEFICRDMAGNTASKNNTFKIDSQKPILRGSNPANNSQELDTNLEIELNISDESAESGLNTSSTEISLSSGELKVKEINNSSITADISNLEEGQSYQIDISLQDKANHSTHNEIHLETKKPENDDSGSSSGSTGGTSSSSGGGGGFTGLADTTEEGVFRTDYSLSSGETKSEEVEDAKLSSIIENISIEAREEASSELRIEKLDQNLEEKIYSQLNITTDNTAEVSMTFKVNRSWIDRRNGVPEDIVLEHQKDGWEKVETELKTEEADSYAYESELKEFSIFRISLRTPECRDKSKSAVDPEEPVCEQFESSCGVPDGWRRVESCSQWERENLGSSIESLRENSASIQREALLQKAERATQEGNISKANQLIEEARNWKPQNEEDSDGNPLHILIAALLLATAVTVAVRHRRKKSREKIAKDIDELNRALEGQNRKLAKAGNEVDEGNYEDAAKFLGEFRENMKRKRQPSD